MAPSYAIPAAELHFLHSLTCNSTAPSPDIYTSLTRFPAFNSTADMAGKSIREAVASARGASTEDVDTICKTLEAPEFGFSAAEPADGPFLDLSTDSLTAASLPARRVALVKAAQRVAAGREVNEETLSSLKSNLDADLRNLVAEVERRLAQQNSKKFNGGINFNHQETTRKHYTPLDDELECCGMR